MTNKDKDEQTPVLGTGAGAEIEQPAAQAPVVHDVVQPPPPPVADDVKKSK